jgi:hypothetical protein
MTSVTYGKDAVANKICIRCLTRQAKAIDNLASVLIAAAANEGIARSGLRQMFFKN